jgi:hypothetical protein
MSLVVYGLLILNCQLSAQIPLPNPYTSQIISPYGYVAQGSSVPFTSIAGRPDTLYYAFGGGLAVPEDDGYANLSLPFQFRFFNSVLPAGNPIFASANGFLVFGTSSTTVVPVNLMTEPASFGNQPAIVPLFDDLVARGMQMGGPGLYVQVTGSPGSQKMTFEWSAMQHYNNGNPTDLVSFQVTLHESDGTIVFNYDNTVFGNTSDMGQLATVGIRDTTFSNPPDNVVQWGFSPGSKNGEGIMLGSSHFQISFTMSAVPEPASLAMISLAGVSMAGVMWYRRRKVQRTAVRARR